jgi:hypothetical protein
VSAPIRARSIFGGALALGLSLGSAGCASQTKIYVQSKDQTNAGNVLHMIRSVDAKTAATAESYQEVAAMLFADPRDPSVLSSEPVFPGRLTTVTVDQEKDKSLVLYFFFTSPGDNWRIQVANPLPAEVYIGLGVSQIESAQMRR